MLIGPPPSFQASLLELQADLRTTLAWIAARRCDRQSFGSQPPDP